MRKLLLAIATGFALFVGGHAALAACPTPNPNLLAPPFVDGCLVSAAALNHAVTFAQPYASVKAFGATGNGTTDDTAAITATIASLASTGGTVFFPVGTYCVKSGPITVPYAGITLLGQNRQVATVLSVCGVDRQLITISGYHDTIKDLGLFGSQTINGTNQTVSMLAGCFECTMEEDLVEFGGGLGSGINMNGSYENYLKWNEVFNGYGTSLIYAEGAGGYYFRNKEDQAYPYATPAANTTAYTPWAATTAYAAGAIVTTNNYRIQATVGGTSGGSAPSVPIYGTPVVDGTVTWKLVGQTSYIGMQFDTGSGIDTYEEFGDFSSTTTTAIAFTNTLSGSAPSGITVDHNTICCNSGPDIDLIAGYKVAITNSDFGECQVAGCSHIIEESTYEGDVTISGNWFGYAYDAIAVQGGYQTMVWGNTFANQSHDGIEVAANQTDFNIWNNQCGSTIWGGPANYCIEVDSGTSNYYVISGNNTNAATGTVNDLGTGTSKMVQNLLGNENDTAGQGVVHMTASPTIASGGGTGPSIFGNNQVFSVFIGSGGASSVVVNFSTPAWKHTPSCIPADQNHAELISPLATTTQITLSGTMSASDQIVVLCQGYR